jgi:hypothetical protein
VIVERRENRAEPAARKVHVLEALARLAKHVVEHEWKGLKRPANPSIGLRGQSGQQSISN